METILANISGKVRREKLWGRDFWVAPTTMLVPGVLNGNKGPLLYRAEKVLANYLAWNHMPIVVPDHPKKDGKFTSARFPDIIDKYGVGFVFNSTGEGKLGAEAWFDIELTRQKSPETHDRLASNQSIELSTGLFPKITETPGVFNGTNYVGEVESFDPDHLAVLPNGVGACSRQHGCGVLVNEDRTLLQKLVDLITNKQTPSKETPVMGKLSDQDRTKLVDSLVTNCGCTQPLFTNEDKEYLAKLPDERLTALHAEFEKQAKREKFLANAAKGIEQGGNVIIVNAESGSVELKTKQPTVHEIGGKEYKLNEATGNLEPLTAEQPAGNTAAEKPKPKTEQEYFNEMPPNMRAAFQSFIAVNEQQKNQYISVILANAANEYKAEELAVMELPQLKKLAALAGNQQQEEGFMPGSYASFFGAGTPSLALNQEEMADTLDLPTMDFTTTDD